MLDTERPHGASEECCHSPTSDLPNSCHLHALSLLPTLPLWVLVAGCCTYGQDGCTTCLRHSLQYPVCAALINMRKRFLLPFSCCLCWFQKRFKLPLLRSPKIDWFVADVKFVYSRRLRFATAIPAKHLTESQYNRQMVGQTKDL